MITSKRLNSHYLGYREELTGVSVCLLSPTARVRVCFGCQSAPHPTGNWADWVWRRERRADNRFGPRAQNLKPATTHSAVCLQEILEPLSALSGCDNRWQQTCYTHNKTHTYLPTHAAGQVILTKCHLWHLSFNRYSYSVLSPFSWIFFLYIFFLFCQIWRQTVSWTFRRARRVTPRCALWSF